MEKHIIVGVHIVDRETHAQVVQGILTKYGTHIQTRLGLRDNVCPMNGLILLEMADTLETGQMIDEIEAIDGVDCQSMVFEH